VVFVARKQNLAFKISVLLYENAKKETLVITKSTTRTLSLLSPQMSRGFFLATAKPPLHCQAAIARPTLLNLPLSKWHYYYGHLLRYGIAIGLLVRFSLLAVTAIAF
jgi:hypothetical protein